MRSPADLTTRRRVRLFAERALRATLILILLFAIRHALFAMNEQPSVKAAGGDNRLHSALADWSTVSSPRSAHLRFDSAPSPATRDWASDLRGAGTAVSWASALPATAVSVEPIADPKGKSRVWI
ncbi:MAG: hypothetical protein M3Z17_05145, partial [Gemmatimonadota bacterium]|nr:hypothetical protein [Gemmatimonadota bacterium]